MLGRQISRRTAAVVSSRPKLLHDATRRAYSPLLAPGHTSRLIRTAQNPQSPYLMWPAQRLRLFTNLPIHRTMSFQRVLPSLFMKLVRVPAALGGVAIAGLAYVNYKVQEAGAWTMGIFNQGKDFIGDTYSTASGKFRETVASTDFSKPEWFQQMQDKVNEMMAGQVDGGGGGQGKGSGSGQGTSGGGGGGRNAQAAAATAAALGYSGDEDSKQGARDDQMMVLTRKMIEIRSILQRVGQSGALQLPSIVVIGSQSSGKSSVLEAIVGHEFLPKGSNMVTRRPIELTLINTPNSTAEYGEFPAVPQLGKISDFTSIQRTLTDLNLAVSDKECVSDDPIQLNIYSPNVPDLSLIDLPGYIQLSAVDQPEELKSKIAALCEKYIQAPNVILAISAADVDLANSTALRASRRVDPRGERTIGVISKMDLVDADRASSMLKDKNYPLRLGYVGVVCKIPSTGGIFSRNVNITNAISKNENAYFSQHPAEFGPDSGTTIGTNNLRRKLMEVLEATMSQSLQGTSDAIHQELEEVSYQFKVEYNDRPLTADTYLAESLDSFKHLFKEFTNIFGRPQVRELLKHEINQRMLDILAARYWNKPFSDLQITGKEDHPLSELPLIDADSLYWQRRLDASTSTLTKFGIGRLATNVVANSITQNVDQLIEISTFRNHPFAKKAIQDATNQILNERFYSTSDQVENCIKPYKFEIEIDDREWQISRENTQKLFKEELRSCEDAMKVLKTAVGGKKLNQVMAFIDRIRDGKGPEMKDGTETLGFSQAMLEKGREGVFLRDRADLLKMRMYACKGKQCANKKNKYHCPEIFMDAVAEKLTGTAVLFLNVELLSEFYYNFPRELDVRLGRHLSQEQVESIAREDPKIRKHVDLQKRKALLELALQKMENLIVLEKSKNAPKEDQQKKGNGSHSRWGGFF